MDKRRLQQKKDPKQILEGQQGPSVTYELILERRKEHEGNLSRALGLRATAQAVKPKHLAVGKTRGLLPKLHSLV